MVTYVTAEHNLGIEDRILKPNELVAKTADIIAGEMAERKIKKVSVVDLGCWKGNTLIYLANRKDLHFYYLLGIDISGPYIDDFRKKIGEINIPKEMKDRIGTLKGDITNLDSLVKGKADFFITLNVLQFLCEDEVSRVIKMLQRKTNPNGYNIIQALTPHSEKEESERLKRNSPIITPEYLQGFYLGWEIIHCDTIESAVRNHGQEDHKHYLTRFIARNIR